MTFDEGSDISPEEAADRIQHLHGSVTKNIDRTNTSVYRRFAVEMQSTFFYFAPISSP